MPAGRRALAMSWDGAAPSGDSGECSFFLLLQRVLVAHIAILRFSRCGGVSVLLELALFWILIFPCSLPDGLGFEFGVSCCFFWLSSHDFISKLSFAIVFLVFPESQKTRLPLTTDLPPFPSLLHHSLSNQNPPTTQNQKLTLTPLQRQRRPLVRRRLPAGIWQLFSNVNKSLQTAYVQPLPRSGVRRVGRQPDLLWKCGWELLLPVGILVSIHLPWIPASQLDLSLERDNR
ncbi:hypothetical protein IWZ00DRAFT_567044, partial [Phyllosticta capitalensis]